MNPTGPIDPNQNVPQQGTPVAVPHQPQMNDVRIEYLRQCILGNSSYLHLIPTPSPILNPSGQSALANPDSLSSATTVNSLPPLLPFANGSFLFPVDGDNSNEGKDPETKSIMDDIIAECMNETQKYNDYRYRYKCPLIKETEYESRRPDRLDLFPNRTNDDRIKSLRQCILESSSYLHPIPTPSPNAQSALANPDTLSSAATSSSLPPLQPFANGSLLPPATGDNA
jgi:hypothetical protein